MNEEKIMAVIEAVLFAMGDSVELSKPISDRKSVV